MSITVVGLGPSGPDGIDGDVRRQVMSAPVVVVRTLDHPAARSLAADREVIACDDLYDTLTEFDDVYTAIVDRVLGLVAHGDVVYAVPGSPSVGERTVPLLVAAAEAAGVDTMVVPATSFLDLVYLRTGIDPIAHGVQIVDARDLPDPLPFHVPTVITQVDSHLRAADLAVALGRTLSDETEVMVLDRLGDEDEIVVRMTLSELSSFEGGARASVVVPATDVGLLGLVATNRVLRGACPWDRAQTHHSLLTHLLEEAYETADALGHLPSPAPGGEADFGAYAEVEDELGDLLLQVIFHSTLAAEAGAFDIDEVAELNRRKLVRRHPHVFGGVHVDGASEVLENWERIKQEEKSRTSLMDDVPAGMPAVARAMKVQKRAASVRFDFTGPEQVLGVIVDELAELNAAVSDDDPDAVAGEIGDVLFSVINLSRHVGVDPETALRASVQRFMDRFRVVESVLGTAGTAIADATADELDAAWHEAKRSTSDVDR